MTTTVKATAILPHTNLLPRDEDDNTFVFNSEDVNAAALIAALEGSQVVQSFYNSQVWNGKGLCNYLSGALTRATNGARVEYTDISTHLDGSPAGPPQTTTHFTLGLNDTATDLPNQVAAVATLYGLGRAAAPVIGPVEAIPTDRRAQNEGAPATHSGKTHPKQSHTGRIYVGPLNANTIFVGTNGEPVFAADFLTTMTMACHKVRQLALALTVPTAWVVWSRKLAIVDDIVGGHVDNMFDTQRRRVIAASSRTSWS